MVIYIDDEVREKGQKCDCGGEIDLRVVIQTNPHIWHGVCFQCGERFQVVEVKDG